MTLEQSMTWGTTESLIYTEVEKQRDGVGTPRSNVTFTRILVTSTTAAIVMLRIRREADPRTHKDMTSLPSKSSKQKGWIYFLNIKCFWHLLKKYRRKRNY